MLEWPIQILLHTPAWVYVLLVFLVSRGLRARKPGEVAPARLAIVPALLTGWGIYDLVRLYGVSAGSLWPWLLALGAGAWIGAAILRGLRLEVDRQRGIIHRPADLSVLPLVLLAFGIKYAFGVVAAVSPGLLQEPAFRLLDLGASGLFAGIFVGRFAFYLRQYLAAPSPA